jgi:hypothetical protein
METLAAVEINTLKSVDLEGESSVGSADSFNQVM